MAGQGASFESPSPAGRQPGPLPLFTTGAFELELHDLLRERCRLVFLLGLTISIVLIALARAVIPAPPATLAVFERWEWVLDLLHLVSFGAGLAYLYVGRPGTHRLQLAAAAVLALNIVLVVVSMGVVVPDYPPLFALSLLLFVPAAVIPWRVSYQLGLGALAVLAPLLIQLSGYALEPSVRGYWDAKGGRQAFVSQLVVTVVGVAILAGLSALVTRTLYDLRKTTHQAKRLGHYLLRRELGKGGMGEVFVAEHARMCRPTAVKVLRVTGPADTAKLARFEREIRLASSLTHPNTITIFDFGRGDEGTFFYAMEYLEGIDLEELVRRFGPVEPSRVVYLLLQVCGSLGEAHRHRILHRDLKPSNVFLTNRGGLYDFVKVLDFGIAKEMEEGSGEELTRTGLIIGTPQYIAPETCSGSGRVDGRADIYSLGGLAYFLLTGRPPFVGDTPMQLVASHLTTPPRPPSEICEIAIPAELERIVLRCLEKSPESRFQTAGEVEAALRAVLLPDPWTREKAEEWWNLHQVRPSGAAAG